MNFSYLVEGFNDPPQEVLQRFKQYVVVVVLSEDDRQFILDTSSYDMRTDELVAFWVIRPVHFATAAPGSVLSRIREAIGKLKVVGDGDHSFVAAISKDELRNDPESGGHYFPLMIGEAKDKTAAKVIVRTAIAEVLREARVEQMSALEKIRKTASPAALVAYLLKAFTTA